MVCSCYFNFFTANKKKRLLDFRDSLFFVQNNLIKKLFHFFEKAFITFTRIGLKVF